MSRTLHHSASQAAAPAVRPEYLTTSFTSTQLLSRFPAIGLEDPKAFENRTIDYHIRFGPVGPDESHLVDTLVICEFRKQILVLALTGILQKKLAEHAGSEFSYGEIYAEDLQGSQAIWKIERQIDALDRIWFRSLEKLRSLQKERQLEESAQPANSVDPLPDPLAPVEPAGYAPVSPAPAPQPPTSDVPSPGPQHRAQSPSFTPVARPLRNLHPKCGICRTQSVPQTHKTRTGSRGLKRASLSLTKLGGGQSACRREP